MEDEERQPENGERVLGAQVARVDVYLELFAESVDGDGSELAVVRVDVGQVVAGLVGVWLLRVRPPPSRRLGTRVAVKLPYGTGKPTLT